MNQTMLFTVVAFALINYALKAAGPVMLHGRKLPPRLSAVIDALAPALLAGMLVGSVAGPQWSNLDPALMGGLVAATLAWLARGGQLGGVVACMLVTALLRAVL
jgi:branched-subunit amino acid transport protein